jgi:hypothetical protein
LIELIEERTKLYKKCALSAKNANVMEKAREFLRISKELDNYLKLLKNGDELPIEQKQIPPAPKFSAEEKKVDPVTTQTQPKSQPTQTQPKPQPTQTQPKPQPTQTQPKPTQTPSSNPTKSLEKPTTVKKPNATSKPLPKKTIKKIVKKKVKKKVVNHKKQELLEKKKKMELEEKKRIQSFEKFIEEFSNQMKNCLQKAKVKNEKRKNKFYSQIKPKIRKKKGIQRNK